MGEVAVFVVAVAVGFLLVRAFVGGGRPPSGWS